MFLSQQPLEQLKAGADVGAAALTVSVIMNWAPAVAAVFTALYAIFRLYEAMDKHFQQRRKDGRWPFHKGN